MKLRDYQVAAIEDIERRRLAGAARVPLVLATGLGKTQIFTSYADRWLAEHPGQRVLIIAHTNELIEQAARRARQVAPGRRIGIVKAEQNEVLAEIVVSSRQTLASGARRDQLRRIGLIIIDEAHHAVRHNTYGKILEHFGAFDEKPAVFTLGFTATLARSDKAKLSTVWQDCTFTRDILFGIRNGYLLDVRGERVIVPDLDMSNVRVTRGDYSDNDIAEELERTFAPEVIAREYARLAERDDVDRFAWRSGQTFVRRGIAFWPLVDTSYHGAKAFNDVGIRSDVVHGQLPRPERREILKRFALPLSHSEALDVVHNAMVLTEGFDEPTADVVVIARPTRSAPLYQQMVGRVLRPDLTVAPELREKALILDVTGAAEGNDLRSLIDLSPERKLRLDPEDEDKSLLELDEYLLEIEAELDGQREGGSFTFDSPMYAGATETKAFDPLGRDKTWGRTPAGTLYIPRGDGAGFVFITESIAGDPGTYDIVTCSTFTYVRDGVTPWQSGTEHVGLSLDMALSWGEDVAGISTLNKRKSRWRKEPPRPGHVAYGLRLGITDAASMNKGELSEAIDAKHAERRIDPLVRMVKAMIAEREAREKEEVGK